MNQGVASARGGREGEWRGIVIYTFWGVWGEFGIGVIVLGWEWVRRERSGIAQCLEGAAIENSATASE